MISEPEELPEPPLVTAVRVPDVDEALRFYTEALGGDLTIFTTPGARASTIGHSNAILLILPADAQPPEYDKPGDKGRTPRLELRVADARAAVDRFLRAGGTLRYLSPDAGYAHVHDPFGHLWAFWQPDK